MAMVIPHQSFLYRLMSTAGVGVIALAEWLIDRVSSGETFYDTKKFTWVETVEAMAPEIVSELEAVMHNYETIPQLKDLSAEQERIVSGNRWKSYFFYAYGKPVNKNIKRCPHTMRALHQIPGMVTAFYSILEPNTRLIPHRGTYKGVLRYHLALKVPADVTGCALKIGEETRHWQTGKSLVFDDSYLHEAWNNTEEMRVVLFVDFVRPLPFPVSAVNKVIVWLISRSPYIQNILAKA